MTMIRWLKNEVAGVVNMMMPVMVFFAFRVGFVLGDTIQAHE